MLAFALDGLTSFSIKPIKIITRLGIVISFFGIIALIWSITVKIFGHSESGWSSLMASIWFIGGIEIMSIGIMGEYIGKIYTETKGRPRYIIEDILNEED